MKKCIILLIVLMLPTKSLLMEQASNTNQTSIAIDFFTFLPNELSYHVAGFVCGMPATIENYKQFERALNSYKSLLSFSLCSHHNHSIAQDPLIHKNFPWNIASDCVLTEIMEQLNKKSDTTKNSFCINANYIVETLKKFPNLKNRDERECAQMHILPVLDAITILLKNNMQSNFLIQGKSILFFSLLIGDFELSTDLMNRKATIDPKTIYTLFWDSNYPVGIFCDNCKKRNVFNFYECKCCKTIALNKTFQELNLFVQKLLQYGVNPNNLFIGPGIYYQCRKKYTFRRLPLLMAAIEYFCTDNCKTRRNNWLGFIKFLLSNEANPNKLYKNIDPEDEEQNEHSAIQNLQKDINEFHDKPYLLTPSKRKTFEPLLTVFKECGYCSTLHLPNQQ